MIEVAPSVFRLGSPNVNFYLIEQGGRLTMVDAGLPVHWAQLAPALAARGWALEDVDAILLTHAHGDHAGIAEKARVASAASVWLHAADMALVKKEKRPQAESSPLRFLWRPQTLRTVVSFVRGGILKVPAVTVASTFDDGEVVDVPGKPRVVHVPGHTAGSCALVAVDGAVAFTGDALVTLDPITGKQGPRIMSSASNENSALARSSLDRLAKLDADVVLPGHGEPFHGPVSDAVRQAGTDG